MKIQSIMLLAALGFASACGSSGGKKDRPQPEQTTGTITASELALTDQGSFDALEVGKPIKIIVKGKNEKGEAVEMKADSWEVKPATLASVNAEGLLLPQAAGTGELVATIGKQQLKAKIQVVDPELPTELVQILINVAQPAEL
ncbi:MAG TPA: hypothetical protein VE954_15885 [Oligoflexus sp.]|uniref:hypothetical protein n=1 Tax=Oligoflexus sp. TaxID=1971216 RepID=UPI002D36F6CB|nr:hypothetical protein [Oligoflexus sp.]HYX34580.1 hypothetical protein [Oligoflexus sp.]